MLKIKRALISCSNKTGIVELGQFLAAQNVEILSTGGTAKRLRDSGVPVREVSEYTGFPEILDGRVKTLHPKVHGGILGRRDQEKHKIQMAEARIQAIDLVVVNLYPFKKAIAQPGATLETAIENIDIGGPAMLRASAKNYRDVLVVMDPADYPELIERLKNDRLTEDYRLALAVKVFELTAAYDAAIHDYLAHKSGKQPAIQEQESPFASKIQLTFKKIQDLRYGENPHQKAAFFKEEGADFGIVTAKQWQGKELSFNNILDLESAYRCCREFACPACVIVKHLNPCGVALAPSLSDAFLKARQGDPVSSFGGIVALNGPVDKQVALLIAETFFEAVIAPDFDDAAREIFQKRKNLRVLSLGHFEANPAYLDYRRVGGGLLVQEADTTIADVARGRVVTQRKPTQKEIADLNFAWHVVKHVKSNAIVLARDNQTVGIGAGQMSRIDAVTIAGMKARDSFKDRDILKAAVMASDAFFPFRDGVDAAARLGITAIVQPGGSIRDKEVIAACNEHDMAMVFTGMRHFRH